MKILLIGASGKLGRTIQNESKFFNFTKSVDFLCPSRDELDLLNEESINEIIRKNKPDWIINAGAYTQVEKAELNEDLVLKINVESTEKIALMLKKTGGKLIQISTDFVFDGEKNSPYLESYPTNPINVYGKSKALCEKAIEEILSPSNQGIIVRTSWLIGPTGNNFAKKIIRLLQEKDSINVVEDQIGRPTTTNSLAKTCFKIIEKSILGKDIPLILHSCNSGIASWYDVAVAIKEICSDMNLINKDTIINPISSENYPTIAKRPKYSVLDIKNTSNVLDLKFEHWRKELRKTISMMK